MTPRAFLLSPSRHESRARGRADVLRCLDAADALGVPPEAIDHERADADDARQAAALCVAVTADRLLARAQDERAAAEHYRDLHCRDERRAADALADLYGALVVALRRNATLARLDLPETDPP